MRLLVLNLAMDPGHPVVGFASGWVRALAARVDSVTVITLRLGAGALGEGIDVCSVGGEDGVGKLRRIGRFYRCLSRVFRRGGIDLCFSHMSPELTLLAGPILKAARVPIVTWYAHPSLTWCLRAAHRLSDCVVASLASAYPYHHDKLMVVGQGIDTIRFAPNGMPPEEPPIILCVGRLSPSKDHPTLLQAARMLRDEVGAGFHVVIVGGRLADAAGARYEGEIRRLTDELGLASVVTFTGAVDPGELPGWYARCTVHVNLTPRGFGDKVALEAMSCGRPCLTANDGFAETLGRFSDLLLFRPGDARDLAARLARLLALPWSERRAMGDYLRARVIELHALDRLADRLVEVFRTVLRERRSRRSRFLGTVGT
jgi:glycosyltransferase involved in cell wall biosynthesis